ncbi:MAG: twin-arginine translocase subunit TatC [Thermoleophilia bacterium]|nr:twin-arginine translocase subunit TatC [Thermoleophilia bacterium]
MTSGGAPAPTRRRSSRLRRALSRSAAAARGDAALGSSEVSVNASRAPARPREREDQVALVDHLDELRTRVIWCGSVLVAAFIACYWQRAALFSLLDRPLHDRAPIQTFGVTEPFFTSVSVAAQAALVATIPVIAWHLWRFVRPAIAPDARRTIRALLVAAPILFTTGVVFAYFLILGPAVRFLLGIAPDSITVVVRASDYYHFVTTTLLSVGAAFCFPLLLLGLARIGVLTVERMQGSRRVAYALMAILAALLPTGDPVSLALEILPLIALYEASLVAVRVQERRLARRDAAATMPA